MAQEELRTYYNYLYPFHTIVNWLTHNGKSLLSHRELSFEYEGGAVQRYVVFNDADTMKLRMIDPRMNTPRKVDAGAIWNRIPEKESTAKTIQREFVFDFDMNDYDDVRTCCEGKTVCVRCWKLLIIAVEIIEKALAEDYGFTQLMYVFSGGRGMHIWICDKRAREMKDSIRKAIVDYLELVTGNEKAASLLADKVVAKVDDNNRWKGKLPDNASRNEVREFYYKYYLSAHVERSLKVLADHFFEVMEDQRVFEHEKCVELMQKIMKTRSEKLNDRVKDRWARCKGASVPEMFKQMVNQIERFEMAETIDDYNAGRYQNVRVYRLSFIQEEIMLSFLYPRMDYNVSTMQNHLLKLPFSVHPTSKKISIPLFKSQIKGFDPQRCVKINDLLKDLDYSNLADMNEINAMKSLLREPIEALKEFSVSLN